MVVMFDRNNLCLLKHYLRNPDPIRVSLAPPRELASVISVVGEQRSPHFSVGERLAGAAFIHVQFSLAGFD
jgi:hypothetical protein